MNLFIVIILGLFLSESCRHSETKMLGDQSSKEAPKERVAEEARPIQPEVYIEPEVYEEPEEIPFEIVPCTETVPYDPSEFLCHIPVSEPNSIWDNVGFWQGLESKIIDKSSAWISAAEKTYMGDWSLCSSIPKVDQLVFVSHFSLENTTKLQLQTIMDNIGTVRLWKNADPKQEVYLSAKDISLVDDTVILTAGFYSVVIDSVDEGVASGIVFTAYDSENEQTILKSGADQKTWCMFRRKADSPKPISQFVPDVASCRSCLIGSSP